MQGILLVNKPAGWTSFDVVAFVRKLVAAEQQIKPSSVKVGHIGTLDPLATGLLVLLIGKQYTKLASSLSKLDKQYLVELKLGETSLSGDLETDSQFYSAKKPTIEQLTKGLKTFEGDIMQTPPVYSAIKVNGQRAYKLARSGKTVEMQARPVTIKKLTLIHYEYPLVSLEADVSSGTYIRSLVADLGEKLGTGAYMTKLTRTTIGSFKLSKCLEIKKLTYQDIEKHLLRQL